jgi:peptidyl-prolyl cis-trans isomerase SurA|tara:strand:- start:7223 stop:8158 length:936 start_codon:yes stop_codon:yes gene_type:complete
MIKNIILKFVYAFILIFLFINSASSGNKIKIELQIGNEILTNIDFLNEKNYLIALNNNLKTLPKNQLKKISKESLIREKIKKIELLKFYDFEKADKYSDQLLSDFYKRLNFKNKDDFNSYLISYNLNISDIREKLKIETLWNEMIFQKYNNQIKIDKEKIKTKIKNQKKILKEYNLSEILFQLKSDEKLLDKYNLILQNIENSGFKNSANIFSISDSSKFGGEIGWINQNQLNDNLLREIENLNINKLTKPIQTSNGYLIIKLNNKREKEKELDFERTFKQMITEEKNRQLNQFSLIYFNKIKQNIFISEK